ncbi:hypothetical protein [Leptospira sp. GIMC2001]|uniref:hypothetical protein n=1 Tax=Leptospira sp. GIMC2001 TaxID=1513297 RepID=UPI0023497D34|nr:hypothetical protein [Leptospira sp. GIMC2001]WCL51006.1 hypothetical protein O4O04_09400 [Leptospira sp. GIMC2001]
MKTISIFIFTLIFYTISCDDKETHKIDKKERITWIRKYIKETDLQKGNSSDLVNKASFYYQKEILTGVAEPEDLYSKTDKDLLIDFIKNTSKRLKIRKLNESLAIIKTYDFDSAGEIIKEDHLWIKKNGLWFLFELEGGNLPYKGQKILIEELKDKKGKFILLHGGCCDTESLAILPLSNNQVLEPLYTGTLYESSYKFIRKNGKLVIFEKDMEDNLTEISLEPR